MSGYLNRLSARVTGGAEFLRPRAPSRFEGFWGTESHLDSTVETIVESRREPAAERKSRAIAGDPAARTPDSHAVVREKRKPENEMPRSFRSESPDGLKPGQDPLPTTDRPPIRHREISGQTEELRPRDAIERTVDAPPPPPAVKPAQRPEEPARITAEPTTPVENSDPGRSRPSRMANRNREPGETFTPLPAESTFSRSAGDATEVLEVAETQPLPPDGKMPDTGDANGDRKSGTDSSTSTPLAQTIVPVPADGQGSVIEVRINRIELNAATEPLSAKKQAPSSRALKGIPSLAEYLGHKEP